MILEILSTSAHQSFLNDAEYNLIQAREMALAKSEKENYERLEEAMKHYTQQAQKGDLKDGHHHIPLNDQYTAVVTITHGECFDIDFIRASEKKPYSTPTVKQIAREDVPKEVR